MGQSDSHGNSERLYTHVQFTPTQRNNPGEIISIRLVSVLVFLAGISQLLFWTVAQLTKSVVFFNRHYKTTYNSYHGQQLHMYS